MKSIYFFSSLFSKSKHRIDYGTLDNLEQIANSSEYGLVQLMAREQRRPTVLLIPFNGVAHADNQLNWLSQPLFHAPYNMAVAASNANIRVANILQAQCDNAVDYAIMFVLPDDVENTVKWLQVQNKQVQIIQRSYLDFIQPFWLACKPYCCAFQYQELLANNVNLFTNDFQSYSKTTKEQLTSLSNVYDVALTNGPLCIAKVDENKRDIHIYLLDFTNSNTNHLTFQGVGVAQTGSWSSHHEEIIQTIVNTLKTHHHTVPTTIVCFNHFLPTDLFTSLSYQ